MTTPAPGVTTLLIESGTVVLPMGAATLYVVYPAYSPPFLRTTSVGCLVKGELVEPPIWLRAWKFP